MHFLDEKKWPCTPEIDIADGGCTEELATLWSESFELGHPNLDPPPKDVWEHILLYMFPLAVYFTFVGVLGILAGVAVAAVLLFWNPFLRLTPR